MDFDLLKHVQPASGHIAIVGIKNGHVRQHLVPDREEADATIETFLRGGRDVYFGVATYKEATSRTQENVRALKAFWLDIDCVPGKDYDTQEQGLKALQGFCRTVGLPRPTLVDSGYGWHVYWALTEEIAPNQWEPAARRLREVCRTQGMRVDEKVFESARILRVPGTFNFKRDGQVPVTVAHEGEPIAFEEFCKTLGVVPPAPAKSIFDPDYKAPPQQQAMLDGVGYNFKRIMARTANGDGCAQLAYAYTNQADTDYNEWFYALSVAALCEDASTAVHLISKDYPQYDPEEVDRKVASIRKATSCARYKATYPDRCEGCKHLGKISSPRDLGKIPKVAANNVKVEEIAGEVQTFQIPPYPKPYYRGEGGGVWVMPQKNEAGEQPDPFCIYPYDLYVVKRVTDRVDGSYKDYVLIRLHLPADGIREFTLPMMKISVFDEFRKIMSDGGAYIRGKKANIVHDYIMSSADMRLEKDKAEIMRQQFGWVEGNSRFVIGDQEITATGHIYSPPSKTTQKLAKFIGPVGTLDKWKEAAALFDSKGMEPHAFAALSAFGAPLLKFLNQTGAVINLYNPRSGTGKSTVLHLVNSVYGHPKDLRLSQKDTMNGRLLWVGILNNLPATMDELTNMSPEEYSELLYGLSNGKGKERMVSGTNELRENNTTWQTITVSTANASFAEKLSVLKRAPEGELMRLIEYPIGLVESVGTEYGKQMFDMALLENYGHAGPVYLRYIISKLPEVLAKLESTQAKIDRELKLLPRERFWSATIAANLVGGIYAKECGLIGWDLKRIYLWVCQRIDIMRGDTEAPLNDVEQVLGDYLYRSIQNILVIDNGDARSKTRPLPKREPKGELLVRIEPNTKMMYISVKQFKEYCVRFQISYSETTRKLRESGRLINNETYRLAKGTNITVDGVHCLWLKIDDETLDLDIYTQPNES
jgi:hypothetical protein